jgi:hypothetical protein
MNSLNPFPNKSNGRVYETSTVLKLNLVFKTEPYKLLINHPYTRMGISFFKGPFINTIYICNKQMRFPLEGPNKINFRNLRLKISFAIQKSLVREIFTSQSAFHRGLPNLSTFLVPIQLPFYFCFHFFPAFFHFF